MYGFCVVLLSIGALLTSPNASDPLNEEAARLLLASPLNYERKVREFTRAYAIK